MLAQHVGLAHMYAAQHECVGRSEVFLFSVHIQFHSVLYRSGTLVQHSSCLLRSLRGCSTGCLELSWVLPLVSCQHLQQLQSLPLWPDLLLVLAQCFTRNLIYHCFSS